MTGPWLIVAGDLTPLGGMDVANWGLARHLAARGPVEVVAHRVWPDLAATPNVTCHLARRPLGKHLLGEPFLERLGRRHARRVAAAGGRVVVNGGNCRAGDINWVHYVHAAYEQGAPTGGPLRRMKSRFHHRRSLDWERAVVGAARFVVCNSHLTARHVVERLGVRPERARVVYYGCDGDRFPPVTAGERREARAALGWGDRPWAVFVGAMGDARKGFDTLYAAWRELCADPAWGANLAVVGRGAALETWRGQARADGLADRVHFLGFRDDVPRVLAASDVMVHPARYEAYGQGVHEAICRGLPVLVSRCAGVAERYPADLAELLLSDPEDAPALADRLRHWQRHAASWPARVEPFAAGLRARTWDEMGRDFVAATRAEPA